MEWKWLNIGARAQIHRAFFQSSMSNWSEVFFEAAIETWTMECLSSCFRPCWRNSLRWNFFFTTQTMHYEFLKEPQTEDLSRMAMVSSAKHSRYPWDSQVLYRMVWIMSLGLTIEVPLLNLDHVSTVCLWNILYFVLMRDNILTKWQRTNEVTAGVRAPANQAWAALAACHAMTVTSVATEEEGRRVINAMANDQPQQSCY